MQGYISQMNQSTRITANIIRQVWFHLAMTVKRSDDCIDSNDGHNLTFCYLCSVSPHVHERIPPRDKSLVRISIDQFNSMFTFLFCQRRKLIPYKNPKARLSSSLDRLDKHSSADLVSYRFVVRTGKEKNSGTRAQVESLRG